MNKVNIPEVNELNTHDAALRYAEHGITVFPIVANEKNPLTKRGFHDATTDITVINGWWSRNKDANIGIATGTVNGIMVVDVDCKNGINGEVSLAELEKEHGELPETRRHRTPSGGYHLIFSIGDQEIPGSVGKIGEGIDVRADGGYIVAPPSFVDDGKCIGTYVAENPGVPVAEAPEWLVKVAQAKRAAATKGKASPVIPQGQRNDCIFKFALDCKRRGVLLEDAILNAFAENEKCSPPLLSDEIVKTVSSAYRYEIDYVPAEIEEMNRTHAAITIGKDCYVLCEVTCPLFNRPDFQLLSVKGFKDFNSNRYIKVGDKNLKLADVWFSHPNRRKYRGLTFNPKYTPEGYYNVWRGFAVEPVKGDCSLYLGHIRDNITNGDKVIYDYIIGWMAHTVQHPDVLVGVAIVMKGNMGVGKGVFADEFGKLFGRHYMLLNDSNQLVGKFNGHMKDKCLLFADEAFWAGDKQAEGKLKSMITEPTLAVEMKGVDLYTIKSNLHMIFATNNEWAAPAGPRERRFFVIQVGEKHLQDRPYFKAIRDQMDNGGREALLYYLQNYDLSGLDIGKFPQTEALREAKMLTASPVQKFWHNILDSGILHCSKLDGWGDGVVQTEYLYRDYLSFVTDMGQKYRATDSEFGTQLKVLLPEGKIVKERKKVDVGSGKNTERKNCYVIPLLSDCRMAFETFMNTKFDWPAESND